MGLALAAVVSMFVLMQWVATLHGIVHDGLAHPAQVAAGESSSVGHGLVQLVSSHEDGSGLCLGIDHLTHSAALSAVLPSLSLPPPAQDEPGCDYASSDAPGRSGYLARAPPLRA